jgi:hypothetical protein
LRLIDKLNDKVEKLEKKLAAAELNLDTYDKEVQNITEQAKKGGNA